MTEEQKAWIDTADYRTLLDRWRHAPIGDPIFVGEAGEYYARTLARKREEVGPEAHTSASKAIGWGN